MDELRRISCLYCSNRYLEGGWFEKRCINITRCTEEIYFIVGSNKGNTGVSWSIAASSNNTSRGISNGRRLISRANRLYPGCLLEHYMSHWEKMSAPSESLETSSATKSSVWLPCSSFDFIGLHDEGYALVIKGFGGITLKPTGVVKNKPQSSW